MITPPPLIKDLKADFVNNEPRAYLILENKLMTLLEKINTAVGINYVVIRNNKKKLSDLIQWLMSSRQYISR